MQKENNVVKSGMVSSLNLFLTKFIGIIYIIPLNAILATSLNRDYYSVGFRVYEIILAVSVGGFPIAIATLVSRYEAQGNYAYARLVKKYGGFVISALGFVSMLVLFMFATPLAALIKNPAPIEEIKAVAIMLRILALSIFMVSHLGSIRGFYLGIKEVGLYSNSQLIEQIVRVCIIVFGGLLVVNVLKWDRIFAVYITAIAAGLSALVAYILLVIDYRKKYHVETFIGDDVFDLRKQIISQTIRIALPYMAMALLGYALPIIDLTLFNKVFSYLNYDLEVRKEIFTAFTLQSEKLISIPKVIAVGFSVAALPYLTESLEKKDFKKIREQVENIVSIVLLIAVPLCVGLIVFAKPVFHVFFGNAAPYVGVPMLRVGAFVGIFVIWTSVLISIAMALNLRRYVIIVYFIGIIAKLILYYPIVLLFGQYGPLISSGLATIVQIVLLLRKLSIIYKINVNTIYRRVVGILIASLLMIILGSICFVLPITYRGFTGALIAMFVVTVFGGISLLGYTLLVTYFELPQRLLNFDIRKYLRKIMRKR